jgi:hypothetical protein
MLKKREEGLSNDDLVKGIQDGDPDFDFLRDDFEFNPETNEVQPRRFEPGSDPQDRVNMFAAGNRTLESMPIPRIDNRTKWGNRTRVKNAIEHALRCKCLSGYGAFKKGGGGGGTQPKLNDDQAQELIHFVLENDGVSKVVVREQVRLIQLDMFNNADLAPLWRDLGLATKRQAFTDRIECQEDVSLDWVLKFANAHEAIRLTFGEALEVNRWKYATDVLVNRWFNWVRQFIDGDLDPEFMANCDEVMVASTSTGKLVTGRDHVVFKIGDKKLPHFTLLALITAAGWFMAPWIVVPALKSCQREFAKLIGQGQMYAASTANGWVTTTVFENFGVELIRKVLEKRRSCDAWANKTFILFADNATTHVSLHLLEAFAAANILYISFPPHMTHLMQPIDVSWARSFKTFFSLRFFDYQKDPDLVKRLLGFFGGMTAARKLRGEMVLAMVDAAHQATTASLCCNAFKVCGLLPWNPAQVLRMRSVTHWVGARDAVGADPEADDRARRPNVFHAGSRNLTSPETIEELRQHVERLAAQRGQRRPLTRAQRHRANDGRAMLGDLDEDGFPPDADEAGEDDVPEEGEMVIPEEASWD